MKVLNVGRDRANYNMTHDSINITKSSKKKTLKVSNTTKQTSIETPKPKQSTDYKETIQEKDKNEKE